MSLSLSKFEKYDVSTFGALQSLIAWISLNLNLSKAGTLKRLTISSPTTIDLVKLSENSAASAERRPPIMIKYYTL